MIGPSLENLRVQSFTCTAALFLVEEFHVCTWESAELYMVGPLKRKSLLVARMIPNGGWWRCIYIYTYSMCVSYQLEKWVLPRNVYPLNWPEMNTKNDETWKIGEPPWHAKISRMYEDILQTSRDEPWWVWLGTKGTCLARSIIVLGHIQIDTFSGKIASIRASEDSPCCLEQKSGCPFGNPY